MEERPPCKRRVEGSSPSSSTKIEPESESLARNITARLVVGRVARWGNPHFGIYIV